MKQLLFAVTFALFCTCASASDFNPLGFYIGASVGRSDVRTALPYANLAAFDEPDTGWKALIGIRPISVLGAELAYVNFGSPAATTSLSGLSMHSDVRQRAETFSGLFYLPIPVSLLDAYARVGIGRIESNGSINSFSSCSICLQPVIAPVQFSRTDTDFLYGAGVQLKLSAFAIRLEYERFNAPQGDPDLLSAGVVWVF